MRTLTRRDFLKVAMSTVAVGVLAACQPPTATPVPPTAAPKVEPTKAPAATTAPAATAATKATDVPKAPAAWKPSKDVTGKNGVLWGLQYDPHVDAYNRMAAKFKERTGCTLKVEPQSGNMSEKMIAALAACTGPDSMCYMGKASVPLYVRKVLLPCKEAVFDANKIDPQKVFFAESIGAYTWEGEYYGVPVETNNCGYFCNVLQDEMKKLNVLDKYPPSNGKHSFDSYEQMWECAKIQQVVENGVVKRWGMTSQGWFGHNFISALRNILMDAGKGDWWDNANKKFQVNTEEGVRAMELVCETPVNMGIETQLDKNQVDLALSGQVALTRGNISPALQARKLGYSFLGCGAPPTTPGKPPYYMGEAGWGFIVPKNAKNMDVAVAWLQWVATEEGQASYASIYGGITSSWLGLVGKFDHFEDKDPKNGPVQVATLNQKYWLPRCTYYGEGFGYPSPTVDGPCEEAGGLVRSKKIKSKEAVTQIQAKMEAAYKQFLDDLKVA